MTNEIRRAQHDLRIQAGMWVIGRDRYLETESGTHMERFECELKEKYEVDLYAAARALVAAEERAEEDAHICAMAESHGHLAVEYAY